MTNPRARVTAIPALRHPAARHRPLRRVTSARVGGGGHDIRPRFPNRVTPIRPRPHPRPLASPSRRRGSTPSASTKSTLAALLFAHLSPSPHPLPACVSQMLKGGVIMDVVNVEQARIAEEAGAVAVMALERVPADIRKDGGVARMSDPTMIKAIKEAVTIPVMAKARIGHFVEAQILESVGIDYIDESEVLTPADEINHINKHNFKVPVLCGCRDLGEALRRIAEGSSMIRTKGEAGTGNVVEAVRHCRAVMGDIRRLQAMDEDEIFVYAKEIRAPLELVRQTKTLGRLPVVNFAAGGVATPADAALMMQLGMDGVFVGSGIFKSGEPAKRARAIVQAVTHYNDPKILAEVSQGLGEAMVGIDCKEMHFTSYAARSE